MHNKTIKILEQVLGNIRDVDEKILLINTLKLVLHKHSPFIHEPVDCVLWVREQSVLANDYNPNTIAPVENKLLQTSIEKEGFTQPIVTALAGDDYLIIDGYHRGQLGRKEFKQRLAGYLPVTVVNRSSQGAAERIAVTVRHNRARGKHAVSAMSDIVRDLARLGWSDDRIARELGMEPDEILRLKQLSGLAELFSAEHFSDAWTVE